MNAPKRTGGDITTDHPGYNYCHDGILRNRAATRSRRQKTNGRRQIFVCLPNARGTTWAFDIFAISILMHDGPRF